MALKKSAAAPSGGNIFAAVTAGTEPRPSQDSDSPFQALFSASPHAFVFTDNQGKFIDANPAAAVIFGLPREQLIGKHIVEFLKRGIDADRISVEFNEKGFSRGEHQLVRADGIVIDIESYAVPGIHPGRNLSVIRDISRHKQMEDALREGQAHLAMTQQLAHLGSWELDLSENKLTWSDETYRIFGLRPQESDASYAAFLDMVHPDDRAAVDEAYSGSIRNSLDSYEIEHRIIRATGETRWVHEKCEHIRDSEGRMVRSMGMVLDITERKKAEEELRQSENRYQVLSEAAVEGIGISENGRIIDVNDQLADMLGYTRDEMIGMEVTSFLPKEEQDRVIANMSGNVETCIEHKTICKNGRVITVEAHAKNTMYQGRPVRMTTIHDVTQRKQAEAQELLYTEILRILNRSSNEISESIREVVRLIRNFAGFDAVGLRLQKKDDFPYYAQSGFSEQFIREDNALCASCDIACGKPNLECTCGLVLTGGTIPDFPSFTDGGSFWTNSSSEMLLIPPGDDPRINPRNTCIHIGYKSIALIPIRSGKDIVGLVQINDRREGRFTVEMIEFFEGIADQLGLAFKRMQVQEELKSLNESLERRVAERTAELEQRSEQLRLLASELTMTEQRERQKLAQVLHDGLQQILVGAKYRLALLERTPDSKQLACEVTEIIDEAITTSRSLTAELSPPILYQSGFLAGLEWLRHWMHDKHGLMVDLAVRESLFALPQDVSVFLFQAVRELLFNVVKHSDVKTARLEVIQADDFIRVTVEDAGTGFDQTQLRAAGGTAGGFGLFSLNERINVLGGRMEIDTTCGNGSRISLVAPISPTASSSSNAGAETGGDQPADKNIGERAETEKRMRIVLVDDHIVMRQGLAGLLREEPDMEIIGEASDGESAVELVRELKPDIVLMDIGMPKMDGIQATRIIRSELPRVRVIGLSMFQEGEQAEAMREAGASAYVTKSGPSESVIAAIRSCADDASLRTS